MKAQKINNFSGTLHTCWAPVKDCIRSTEHGLGRYWLTQIGINKHFYGRRLVLDLRREGGDLSHRCLDVRICVYTYIFTHTCTCIYTCMYMCVCIHTTTHTHAHTQTYIHACTHSRAHDLGASSTRTQKHTCLQGSKKSRRAFNTHKIHAH
jgi:hypothetical protein